MAKPALSDPGAKAKQGPADHWYAFSANLYADLESYWTKGVNFFGEYRKPSSEEALQSYVLEPLEKLAVKLDSGKFDTLKDFPEFMKAGNAAQRILSSEWRAWGVYEDWMRATPEQRKEKTAAAPRKKEEAAKKVNGLILKIQGAMKLEPLDSAGWQKLQLKAEALNGSLRYLFEERGAPTVDIDAGEELRFHRAFRVTGPDGTKLVYHSPTYHQMVLDYYNGVQLTVAQLERLSARQAYPLGKGLPSLLKKEADLLGEALQEGYLPDSSGKTIRDLGPLLARLQKQLDGATEQERAAPRPVTVVMLDSEHDLVLDWGVMKLRDLNTHGQDVQKTFRKTLGDKTPSVLLYYNLEERPAGWRSEKDPWGNNVHPESDWAANYRAAFSSARMMGPDISNFSWVIPAEDYEQIQPPGRPPSRRTGTAAKLVMWYAKHPNGVILAGAGNNGETKKTGERLAFPSSLSAHGFPVVAVTAKTPDGRYAFYANSPSKRERDGTLAVSTDDFKPLTGTSFATPVISALFAKSLQGDPALLARLRTGERTERLKAVQELIRKAREAGYALPEGGRQETPPKKAGLEMPETGIRLTWYTGTGELLPTPLLSVLHTEQPRIAVQPAEIPPQTALFIQQGVLPISLIDALKELGAGVKEFTLDKVPPGIPGRRNIYLLNVPEGTERDWVPSGILINFRSANLENRPRTPQELGALINVASGTEEQTLRVGTIYRSDLTDVMALDA